MPPSFKAGDRVFVLLGDTPLPAVIEGPAEPDDTGERQWTVRTKAATSAYAVPESSMRPDAEGPNF
ncbi:MAG: hypothetical protein ACRYG8_31635 [Janthinobacterium lividum]